MQRVPDSWRYDEFKQVGRDYGDEAEVAVYDETHAGFRDIEAECNEVWSLLALHDGASVIDFGCGTGAFAIHAAQRGCRVHAVDVSEAMLAYAASKARSADVPGITFHHAGFLTYEHEAGGADAIATTFAFHHLPDFWKGVALKRMHAMLKPGGRLYLRDVVMEEGRAMENIASFIARQESLGGAFFREDAEGHFREEHSTYDWVMDGFITRVGFDVTHRAFDGGVIGTYVCVKA